VEAYKLLEQLQDANAVGNSRGAALFVELSESLAWLGQRGNAKANEVISWFVNAAKSDGMPAASSRRPKTRSAAHPISDRHGLGQAHARAALRR
jgi:hypothetical protein